MSSLAAAKADNFYIDPAAFNPSAGRGSANAIASSDVLRKRRRPDGSLTIRFEMPYDSVCEGCGAAVSHGVRFNADKSKVGMHMSTPVWEFRMRCVSHSGCRTVFVIRTAPAVGDYDFISGVRRRVKDFIPAPDDGLGRMGGSLLGVADAARDRAPPRDAMQRLQAATDDEERAAAEAARLAQLLRDSARRYADPLAAQGAAAARWLESEQANATVAAAGAARGLVVPLAGELNDEAAQDALDAWHAARCDRVIDGRGAAARSRAVASALERPLISSRRRVIESGAGAGAGAGTGTGAVTRGPNVPRINNNSQTVTVSHANASGIAVPRSVSDIVAAGLSAARKSVAAVRDAPLAEAARISASLRNLSGKNAFQGFGPLVSIRAGPMPMRESDSLRVTAVARKVG